ncbi:hypothetical protein [Listeria immobilis]|uniref:hypothetical protein n=1 Tax=Listeria immobilis TaxID=2713502 RepID=UPI0021AB3188|nr:hypothetical protein [Listeria immobilis]
MNHPMAPFSVAFNNRDDIELGRYSVETLDRDQARIVAEYLLENGEVNLKDLRDMIPKGTKNTFKSTETLKNGAKYIFQLADGQKAIIRWHEPDPVAALNYKGSISGTRWTAQIKIGNKQLRVDGKWDKNQSINEVHIPIKEK